MDTIAGICGEPGLQDGPYGLNLFESPELIGVDHQGYIFVLGAKGLIRLIRPSDFLVVTLIAGACGESFMKPSPNAQFDIYLKPVICFKSWIMDYGD